MGVRKGQIGRRLYDGRERTLGSWVNRGRMASYLNIECHFAKSTPQPPSPRGPAK